MNRNHASIGARGVGMMMLGALALAGCAQRPLDDDGKIVRATLALLVTGRPAGEADLCIDNRTRGEPLAIFRTMRAASIDHDLRWHQPTPLHAIPRVTGRALFEDAIGKNNLRIQEPPTVGAVLPATDQRRLDTAATTLSILGESNNVSFGADAAATGAAPRWWLLNRLHSGCERTYVLSRIVRNADTGFVTVSADHWATTYAVGRAGGDWRVTAQWDRWLY
jgi:hypothetical protein